MYDADEATVERARKIMRDGIDLAFARFKATGYLDADIAKHHDGPIPNIRVPARSWSDALYMAVARNRVMAAICLFYLGEPGQPWYYTIKAVDGSDPRVMITGYNGQSHDNVRDIAEYRVNKVCSECGKELHDGCDTD